MKIRIFQLIDWIMLLCALLLTVTGICFIYSSAINQQGQLVTKEYAKQIIWVCLGIVMLLAAAIYDYRNFERYISIVFGVFIILLILTRLFGKTVNGAKSWLGIGEFGIQPGEFGKVIYILFLGWYFHKTEELAEAKRFFGAMGIMAFTMGLILIQPDLGTASVYIPIFFFMCFAAGVPLRYILGILTFGLLTIFIAILPVWQDQIAGHTYAILSILTVKKIRVLFTLGFGAITLVGLLGMIFFRHNKYYYWITYASAIIFGALVCSLAVTKVLKPYQIQRLIIFLDPYTDKQGSGWNIIQSKTAIGAGGFFGKGFLRGTQSHLRFLPEQSTDFIFSILSEEAGFLGGFTVFFLYFILMGRMILIIRRTTNHYGYYVASGILGLFFFHFMVNVGMVMGVMPITGIPLLFLSYGGSSMWTAMVCVGIMMSVNYR
ncbi:MAG: rod shape-determining protein RodA, partial [Treponema sp.]|nr:rod shape-determining protein RodA [Treponema sp.]